MAPTEPNPQAPLQQCLAVEDDEVAFGCVKDLIRSSPPGACRPRLVLLVQPDCEPCREEKRRLWAELQEGVVEQIDITTPEGAAFAQRHGIEAVPNIILLDCNGELVE